MGRIGSLAMAFHGRSRRACRSRISRDPPHQATRSKEWGAAVNLGLSASAGIQREASFTAPRNIFAVPRPDGSLPLSQSLALENAQESVSNEMVAEQVEAEESAQYRYLGFLRMGELTEKQRHGCAEERRRGDDAQSWGPR